MRRLQTIGHMWRRYLEILEDEGHEEGAEVQAFEVLGLKRYCCRRMLLTHVDLIEKLMVYNGEKKLAIPALLGAQGINHAPVPAFKTP
jgi:DNA-directed RNA polymerase I, II, and III subunit RPABC5